MDAGECCLKDFENIRKQADRFHTYVTGYFVQSREREVTPSRQPLWEGERRRERRRVRVRAEPHASR